MSKSVVKTALPGTKTPLENLRKYRFEKKSSLGNDFKSSSTDSNSSSTDSKDSSDSTSFPKSEDTGSQESSKSVDSSIKVALTESKNSQDGTVSDPKEWSSTEDSSNAQDSKVKSPTQSQSPLKCDSKISLQVNSEINQTNDGLSGADSNPDSPLMMPAKRKVQVLSSDTDEEAPKVTEVKMTKKAKALQAAEKRLNIENALKDMIETFPGVDLLVLQDALCQNNWDVETAKCEFRRALNDSINSACSKKRTLGDCNDASKSTKKKRRKEIDSYDEDNETDEDDDGKGYGNKKVFDSDADSDEEIDDELSGDKLKVFEYLSKADLMELQQMHQCSKKKAELIVEARPFGGWKDMVVKLENTSGLGGKTLNDAQSLLQTRDVADSLIKKCERLASKMETAVTAGLSNVKAQPSILSENLKLSDYQLVGLNWLLVMHSHQVNGILADEMGLGKTVQVIAFLSYLKENKMSTPGKPHLIVVPASTLENWQNELKRWCPSIQVSVYYGSQEDRKYQRIQWSKNGFGKIEVVLTTYSMVTSCPEERRMFRIIPLHYAIFDEAHMLKNMYTLRYENLMKINAPSRILVTGTPLQNNLLELMSLLAFVMPKMFKNKEGTLKTLFAKGTKQTKSDTENSLPAFDRTRIALAKDIMKPFVLRRLKSDVLKGLPKKTEEIIRCSMTKDQEKKYKDLVATFSKQAVKELRDNLQSETSESGMAMYMKLRRLANHPLLLRYHFKDNILKDMAKRLQNDSRYKDTVFEYIHEDLSVLSDFELHSICLEFKSCYNLHLAPSLMGQSGKLVEIDRLLPQLKNEGHRVLIFSQFVIVLDVLEEHFKNKGYKFLRLDGSTPVTTRQDLIDEYNKDRSIFIFMLSTRAGGLGINLTTADTVIIHDVDANPHNDKQAEDRCHRIGQTKPVRVLRLVSKGTIEENIFSLAQDKLLLEKEVSTNEENDLSENISVARLLKQALGLDKSKCSNSSPIKCP